MQATSVGLSAASETFQPAPVPDDGMSAPTAESDSDDEALHPAFFRHKQEFWGNGFSAGDDASAQQDHKTSAALGAKVSVPME